MAFFPENEIVELILPCYPECYIYHLSAFYIHHAYGLGENVCGRLKSDFRYSNEIVYNNFPWPENPNEKQIKAIEIAAQKVLDTRLQFPKSKMADLYEPDGMPPALVKAHQRTRQSS